MPQNHQFIQSKKLKQEIKIYNTHKITVLLLIPTRRIKKIDTTMQNWHIYPHCLLCMEPQTCLEEKCMFVWTSLVCPEFQEAHSAFHSQRDSSKIYLLTPHTLGTWRVCLQSHFSRGVIAITKFLCSILNIISAFCAGPHSSKLCYPCSTWRVQRSVQR